MTQALNLALLGNNVDSSGKLSLSAGINGTLPIANGGTGLTAVGPTGQALVSTGSAWASASVVNSVNGQSGAVTIAFPPVITAGNIFVYGRVDGNQTTSSSYTNCWTVQVGAGGTYRVRFYLWMYKDQNYTQFVYGRIYKNNVAVGTERSFSYGVYGNSGTSGEFTEDIAVSAGDLLQIYVRSSDGSATGQPTGIALTVGSAPVAQPYFWRTV